MTTQPTALRLAASLAAHSLSRHGQTQAAAELRRLHQFAEEQIGRATAAEAALQMTKATHALKIAALERQRDALLEALKLIASTDPVDAALDPQRAIRVARAAIAAVEGEKE